jgi:cellulose synthase operon protein YhjQ
MTEHALPDPNETPEDVASLYSWANLHGGKYRDFSASRAQMREKARQRLELASEEERRRTRQQTETQRPTEARRNELAAQQAAQRAAQQTAQEPARQAAELFAQRTAQQAQASQQAAKQAHRQPAAPAPPPEKAFPRQGVPWPPGGGLENTGRPAWLIPERTESSSQPPIAPSPEDTLQGSRNRLASRWFALRNIFDDNAPAPAAPAPTSACAPVLAVFSLAGGVGKTSMVAMLGRMLSARGERILLVDTAAYGLLPFFFGARDQRPGQLRTFAPPVASGDAPIQMITLDSDTLGAESATETLAAEIQKHALGSSRVLVDLSTASGATTRRIMHLAPQILVPLLPDMCSVVSVSSIDAFFENHSGAAKPSLPHYVLNQFDASLPLHLDVREVLRERLGDRLLPFPVRHAPVVSEALAEGMTVMDYASNSAVTEDYARLAGWVKSLSAPASGSFSGVRWSER